MYTLHKIAAVLLITLQVPHCRPQADGQLPLLEAYVVTELDEQVPETSALLYFDQSYWTINDSGNSNILYRLDPKNGRVTQRFTIANAKNRDWEELAEDDDNIYIADIGDNAHVRKEKQVYIVSKSQLRWSKSDTTISAKIIRFSYPAQPKGSRRYNAEAIIAVQGRLHIFTKKATGSLHFTVPAKEGFHRATFMEAVPTKGLVTGAVADGRNKRIVMVGYNRTHDRLLWHFPVNSDMRLSTADVQAFSLGAADKTSQVEGVCLGPDDQLIFSNENYRGVKQSLWSLGKIPPIENMTR